MGRESAEPKKEYMAIDLKSFYASVECRERKLNPLTTNLVVADAQRTEKTICLAVSPSLKAYGIPGRARLFEVVQQVKKANHLRKTDRKVELIRKSKKKDIADYAEYGKKNHFSGMFYLTSDTTLDIYDFVSDEVAHALVEDIEMS